MLMDWKFAEPKRANLMAKFPAPDHNFGHNNASLQTHLGFGASAHTLSGLDVWEAEGKSQGELKLWKKH